MSDFRSAPETVSSETASVEGRPLDQASPVVARPKTRATFPASEVEEKPGILARALRTLRHERGILAFFLLIFLLMMPYLTFATPFVDELDNLVGALAVADGGTVYKDFFSQHTPLMYYIMGLFARMGVSSVAGFRVCFYAIIASFFLFIYYRYKKTFGTRTLLLLPVLFVLDMARNPLVGTVLSDMVQSMALLVLYLEFFRFATSKPQRLPKSSTVAIALAIFFAVGTALMSVYAVAAIFLGVVLVEIERARAGGEGNADWHGVVTSSKRLLGRFTPLAGLLLALLALYTAYFALKHALRAMIYQAFTFNTEIYPKYLGIASTPAGTVLNGLVQYAEYVAATFSQLYTFSSLVSAVLIVGNVAMCCYVFKFSSALSVATALFTVYTGIRGYADFHGTAYTMFSWFCVAYLVERVVLEARDRRAVFATILLFVLCFAPTWGAGLKGVHGLTHAFDRRASSYYLEKYVPSGGYFFDASMDVQTYLDNDVRRASRVASGLAPWIAEAYMPDVISDIENNKPNVVFYDPNDEVWGHRYSEYSQPLQALLDRDYVYYPYSDAAETYSDAESARVWIRKGIGVDQLFSEVVYATSTADATMAPAGEIAGQTEILQTFDLAASDVGAASVDVATYSRTNTSHLNFEFGQLNVADNVKTPLYKGTIDAAELKDNAMHTVKFDQELNVPAGQYYIRLTTDDATPGNAVTVWTADGGESAGGADHLFVNGKESPAEMNFQIMN